MDEKIYVEPMNRSHIPRIREIERLSFSDPWPEDGFDKELENSKVAVYFVARLNEKVVGYIGAWMILEEAHITTFAVDPECRGKRLGFILLLRLMVEAISRGIHWSTLEVNEHNAAAISLYSKFGYRKISVRKKYYSGVDDAHLMWMGQMHMESFRNLIEQFKANFSEEQLQCMGIA